MVQGKKNGVTTGGGGESDEVELAVSPTSTGQQGTQNKEEVEVEVDAASDDDKEVDSDTEAPNSPSADSSDKEVDSDTEAPSNDDSKLYIVSDSEEEEEDSELEGEGEEEDSELEEALFRGDEEDGEEGEEEENLALLHQLWGIEDMEYEDEYDDCGECGPEMSEYEELDSEDEEEGGEGEDSSEHSSLSSNWSDDESDNEFFTPVCKSDRIVGRYIIDKRLETGGFASVFRVVECRGKDSPRHMAMKVYSCNTEPNAMREIAIARGIDHPNVLKLSKLSSFEASNGISYNFVVMQLFPRDLSAMIYDLDDAGKVRDTRTTPSLENMHYRHILQQVLNGVEALHDKGFVHSDLKPENVLVDTADWENIVVQVCDFGSAFDLDEDKDGFSPYGHTLTFSAPEVVVNDTNLIRLGPPVDVFSFGCLFVELVREQPLFFDSSERVLHLAHVQRLNEGADFPPEMKQHRKFFTEQGFLGENAQRRVAHHVPWHTYMGFSQQTIAFVQGCCHIDPERRWTIGKMRELIDEILPS